MEKKSAISAHGHLITLTSAYLQGYTYILSKTNANLCLLISIFMTNISFNVELYTVFLHVSVCCKFCVGWHTLNFQNLQIRENIMNGFLTRLS